MNRGNMMKSIGIVLARGGSKRVPKKNIRNVKGKPLVAHSIVTALESDLTDVYVSSDSQEVLDIALEYGANPILRPSEFATDNAPSFLAIRDVVESLEGGGNYYDTILLLQPTTPTRTKDHINRCLKNKKADALFTVELSKDYAIRLNGCIFMMRRFVLDLIDTPKRFLIDDLIELDINLSVMFTESLDDVDTYEDFFKLESMK